MRKLRADVMWEVCFSCLSKLVIPSSIVGPLQWSSAFQTASISMSSIRKLEMNEQEQNSHFIEGDGYRDSNVQSSFMQDRWKDTVANPHEVHCPDGKGFRKKFPLWVLGNASFLQSTLICTTTTFYPKSGEHPTLPLNQKKFTISQFSDNSLWKIAFAGKHRYSDMIKFLRTEKAKCSDFKNYWGGIRKG